MTTGIAPSLLVLLAACNFDFVVVEVESRQVCVEDLEAELPGDVDGTVTARFEDIDSTVEEADSDPDLPDGWVLTDVGLSGMSVIPAEGIDRLDFVQRVSVHVDSLDPTSELPSVQLVDFAHQLNLQGGTNAYDGPLELEADRSVNLLDYFETGSVEMTLRMDGDMPGHRWAVEIEPCFEFVAEMRQDL